MGELLELPLLLSQLLLSQLLLEVGMLPTLLVLSMLPSVRLRLSQRLRLMLVFSMELTAMVLVLDMLDSDMDTPVLDMLDMADTDLDMEDTVLDMAVVSTMVKQLFIQQKLKSNLFVIQCPLDG